MTSERDEMTLENNREDKTSIEQAQKINYIDWDKYTP
jgi:hypothetical protein